MAATQRQIIVYNYHRAVCQQIGVPQATLKHKSLIGILGAASPTGNVIYNDPGPQAADPKTANTQIWAIWQELPRMASQEVDEPARLGLSVTRGQCPAIDDNQNVIAIEHDDWIADPVGHNFRVMDPTLSPDGGYWAFGLKRER